MQYSKPLLPAVCVFMFFSACCLGTRECMPPYFHYANLRMVSATEGKDLIFGQNSIYDKDKIVFFSLKGNDTTFFPFRSVALNRIGYDSVLEVDFFPAAETAYMRLSNSDIDTMKLAFRTHKKTSCCNASSELFTITYNNTVELNVRNGVQEIKK